VDEINMLTLTMTINMDIVKAGPSLMDHKT